MSEMYEQQLRDIDRYRAEERRFEIARDIARMLVARNGLGSAAIYAEDVARKSVQFADALIAELQKPTPDEEVSDDRP